MACEIKLWWVVFMLMLVLNMQQSVLGAPQVPCYFIFGNSLADNGNNNVFARASKANYPPYGIDFPKGTPTGRFTNGETQFDMIAKLLGFDNYIPPYVSSWFSNILKGVNYASGSAGILNESGRLTGNLFTFNEQLLNHIRIVQRIVTKLGNNTAKYLNKCLYSVEMGTNDYINNYFLPQFYPTSRLYTPEQYAQVLINQYYRQIRVLYKYEARKIALFGVGQLGCMPIELAWHPTNGSACVDKINSAVQLFNTKLKSLVDELNRNLTDAKFIYVNIYDISSASSFISAGFKVLNASCCQASNQSGVCIPETAPCQNRREYVFWDSVHTSEAANKITAQRAYTAVEPSDAYPYDISRLAQL